MSIAALESIGGIGVGGATGVAQAFEAYAARSPLVSGTGYLTGDSAVGATAAASGAGFANSLATAIDSVDAAQKTSSDLAVKAVSGELEDVHDYTVAATEAQVALELTAAIRNKAVDAFNEIMRMQA